MQEYHFKRLLAVLKWPGSDTVAQHESDKDDGDDELEDLVPTQGKLYFQKKFCVVIKYVILFMFLRLCCIFVACIFSSVCFSTFDAYASNVLTNGYVLYLLCFVQIYLHVVIVYVCM